MFRGIWSPRGLAALALLGVVLAPALAAAQQGQPGGPGRSSYPSGNAGIFETPRNTTYAAPGYSLYAAPGYPIYAAPGYDYRPPTSSSTRLGAFNAYEAYYAREAGPPYADRGRSVALNGPVRINVWVPAGATLWFDGAPTTQTGELRRFISPPLPAGQAYVYEVKAKWTQDGQEVTKNRRITVHAGDIVTLALAAGTPQ